MRPIISHAVLAAALLIASARSSLAQETAPAPVVLSTPRPATHGVGPGVGVTGMLLGASPAGLSLAYDGGPWHVDSILSLVKGQNVRANFGIGGRFWYHLHSTTNSDFSVGGGLGYQRIGNRAPGPATNGIFIEAGGQIRAFITSNVALSATLGIAIGTADFETYGIGGDSLASGTLGGIAGVGLHYYFY